MQRALVSELFDIPLVGFEEGRGISKRHQPDQFLANRAKRTVAQSEAHVIDV